MWPRFRSQVGLSWCWVRCFSRVGGVEIPRHSVFLRDRGRTDDGASEILASRITAVLERASSAHGGAADRVGDAGDLLHCGTMDVAARSACSGIHDLRDLGIVGDAAPAADAARF